MTPSITAIIPVFNGRRHLPAALASVFAQTMPPSELIVVDDGSTDGCCDDLADAVRQPGAVPLRLIRTANGGQSAARNKGAAAASGDYLAFLDHDDVWYPSHLRMLAETLARDPELGWAYSDVDEIDDGGLMVTHRFVGSLAAHPKLRLTDMLGNDMMVLPSATLLRRSAFEAVGGFDERLDGYEDDDLFLRIFRRGSANAFLPEATAQYRLHGSNITATTKVLASRRIFAEKLMEMFPDDHLRGRFYVRDLVAPRFLRSAIGGYARALAAGDADAGRRHREDARYFAGLGRPDMARRIAVALMSCPWLFKLGVRTFFAPRAAHFGL